MEKLKIALIGYGRMGKEIAAIAEARGHHIIAKLDSERDWMNHIEAFVAADVAIEFSVPEKAVSNIHKCFDANIPVVVGTTGWYHQLPEVLNRSKEQNQTIFYAPNYSIGMNMMFALSKQMTAMAVNYGYKMELYEKHHIHKLDKPSGTAIELARIIKTQHPEIEGYTLDKHDDPKLLPVEVIREDEVNGIHELILNSDEDSLKLRHEAFNRKGFAKGALMAAEFLNGKKGVFTMDDIFKQMI